MKTRSIFYHEDDCCQIEVLPIETLCFCENQTKAIEQVARDCQENVGYNNIMIREAAPVTLSEKEISLKKLEYTLCRFPRYDEVHSDEYNYETILKAHTIAFGRTEDVAVFCRHRNGVVQNLWLNLAPASAEDRQQALEVFAALHALGDLLLVDWIWPFICPLAETKRLEDYLHQLGAESTPFASQEFSAWREKLLREQDVYPVEFGMTQEDIHSLFGEPDAESTLRKGGKAVIMKYQDIEFHFDDARGHRLFLIYSEDCPSIRIQGESPEKQ